MSIPFNRAWSATNQLDHLQAALAGGQTAGDSTYTKLCHAWLESRIGCARAFLTPSCTAALEMCALLMNIQAGDEVIVPSFTFVSTASAFALFGAKIIFADVMPDTLTLDLEQVRKLITPRTKAVVYVAYAGISPELQPFVDLCQERGIRFIEDAAHALGSTLHGRPLGSIGALATLSFHESKNFSAGEGGALLVNDPALVQRAEILREKGTNRASHLRREIAKYSWVDLGSSYLASDLCAAALYAQFEDYHTIQTRRRTLWDRYQTELQAWAAGCGIQQPTVPVGCDHSSHLYYLLFPNNAQREAAIAWLKEADIQAYFHYLPLHESPQGQRSGAAPLGCPVTESICHRLLRLPLYPGLTDAQQSAVLERIQALPPAT